MKAADTSARVLVLRQFIALRRAGMTSLEAVHRLVESLPDGPVRVDCRAALGRLQTSNPAEAESDFVNALTSPADAVDRATHLASAFDATLELDAARVTGQRVLQVAIAAPLLFLAAVGLVTGGEAWAVGTAALPPPTQATYDLASLMRIVGVPLAAFAVWLIGRVRVPVYGATSLEGARGLFTAASRQQPLDALQKRGVGGPERGVLKVLVSRRPPEEASAVAVGLAARLLGDGRRQVEIYRVLASTLFAFLTFNGIGVVIIALYLPIFSIAGTIK